MARQCLRRDRVVPGDPSPAVGRPRDDRWESEGMGEDKTGEDKTWEEDKTWDGASYGRSRAMRAHAHASTGEEKDKTWDGASYGRSRAMRAHAHASTGASSRRSVEVYSLARR